MIIIVRYDILLVLSPLFFNPISFVYWLLFLLILHYQYCCYGCSNGRTQLLYAIAVALRISAFLCNFQHVVVRRSFFLCFVDHSDKSFLVAVKIFSNPFTVCDSMVYSFPPNFTKSFSLTQIIIMVDYLIYLLTTYLWLAVLLQV